MFKKEGPALEPVLQGLGTKNWARAYAQGYRVGFNNLSLSNRSKRYRQPKMAAIPWETGYAHGTADRVRKETGIREEESFVGQSLLRNLTSKVSVSEEV